MLPKMAFTGFTSRYREQKISEGFEDVTSVDFKVSAIPRLFQWNLHYGVSHVARLIGGCAAMHPCLTIESITSCPANVGAQL